MNIDAARKWAWNQVKQDVGMANWRVGEYTNFFAFFMWGWNYRGHYQDKFTEQPLSKDEIVVSLMAQVAELTQEKRELIGRVSELHKTLLSLTLPDSAGDADALKH